MAPPLPTLDQLRVLDAIARTGSFSAAARALHRVPSAISYAVKGLEETLGVELFDRSGHRAELTPSGRRLLELARSVLRDIDAMASVATELQGGWEPELRVVLDGALPWGPVVAGLAAVASRGAPTRVSVEVEFQEGVLDRFFGDDGDVMLLLDEDARAAGLPTLLLPPLDMVLVVAPGHPLAAEEGLAMADLDRHVSLVVRDSGRRFQQTPRETFLGSRRVLYLSDFAAKRAVLLGGVGFGWMPLHLVSGDLDAGRLRRVGLAEPRPWTYRPRLLTRADRALGPAGRLFVEAVGVAASSMISNVGLQNVSVS